MRLRDGSRVAVIGGGPAGSFTAYFLLLFSRRAGLDVTVDLYEPKDFSCLGPAGCNMCGGIVSESLVQMLAVEGICLPGNVVQRGLDSYVLHSDVGTVRLETPLQEMRIASVYRGGGPRGLRSSSWDSFDGYLLEQAREKGARVIGERVQALQRQGDRILVQAKGEAREPYDLIVGAVGVNTKAYRMFEELEFGFRPPHTVKTWITEYEMAPEIIRENLGSSMHAFLLDLPDLEFAALIPKGECVTLCFLGAGIDQAFVDRFLSRPEVRCCFPPGFDLAVNACHCSPWMNVGEAVRPYADRVVLVGDGGASRLYKDGIGAAYRTAKAAAVTAIFEGVSSGDFERLYLPAYREIARDNVFGRVVFTGVKIVRKTRFLRRGVLQLISAEQGQPGKRRKMSRVMWDTFTGSASYQEIFFRMLDPIMLARLGWQTVLGFVLPKRLAREVPHGVG